MFFTVLTKDIGNTGLYIIIFCCHFLTLVYIELKDNMLNEQLF